MLLDSPAIAGSLEPQNRAQQTIVVIEAARRNLVRGLMPDALIAYQTARPANNGLAAFNFALTINLVRRKRFQAILH